MHALLKKLQGGDRRSIGRVDEVVDEVLSSPELFRALIQGLFVDDPLIRMRTAIKNRCRKLLKKLKNGDG